jgi:flagellar hook-associated protein 1 FlgK
MTLINNALSGAQAAQAALNTSSQNTANVVTPGYTRQGALLTSVTGAGVKSAGDGVTVSQLMRFSDNFKNLQMWQSASNLGKFEAGRSYLNQLEEILSDDRSNINKGMDDFNAALNAVSVQPDSKPLREQVLTAADGLAKRFASMQQVLTNQRGAIKDQRQSVVTQINTLGKDIASLNKQIAATKATGNNPSALQDARDLRIDSLAALVGVQVIEQADGTRNVSMKGGQPLVVGGDAATLAVETLANSAHELKVHFASTRFSVQGKDFGGQLGGLEDFERAVLNPTQTTLRELGSGIAERFNAQLAAGCTPPNLPGTGKALFQDPALTDGQLRLSDITSDQLAFALDPSAAGDSSNLGKLIALKDKALDFTTFDANGQVVLDPATGRPRQVAIVTGDVFTQLVGKLGVATQQNTASQKTAQIVRDQAEESWKTTSGVNNDEEAINLVQFQQMYQANMKVIAIVNQLFDSTLAIF